MILMCDLIIKKAFTKKLEIGYVEYGPPNGFPIILLHGFPDDVLAWHVTALMLEKNGFHIFVPYLRGFGETKFLNEDIPRAGQQAAIGQDVLDFMDALGLDNTVLAGYDWGCRAACVASVLAPARVSALLAIGGYNITNIKANANPCPPAEEKERWYHWYFTLERGKKGLDKNRYTLCNMLWKHWSPNWQFDSETFSQTARSFENSDFVSVVIQEYRHCYGCDPGDPAYRNIERLLAEQPQITVPSIVLHGASDAVHPPHYSLPSMVKFPERTKRQVVDGGHFLPRENPESIVNAILELTTFSK